MAENRQKSLQGKLLIEAKMTILTGMHIGTGNDFAPIGAVDSPFIRDVMTKQPIVPGSTVKGKLRTLLAKDSCSNYVLNSVADDNEVVARLFGASGKNMALPARLQFFDLFMSAESVERYKNIDTDTYIGEVKFENTISRTTGIANPRQIERVPAGTEFDFKLVYNVENIEELDEDINTLAKGIALLELDYLGGHGSRGYGRVQLQGFTVKAFGELAIDCTKYSEVLERSNAL